MNKIQSYWKKIKEEKNYPFYYTGYQKIESEEFCYIVENHQEAACQLIDLLLAGQAIIIKNCIPKDKVKKLISDTVEWARNTPESYHKMIEKCPNYHENVTHLFKKRDGYSTVCANHYFFRWNKQSDDVGIFDLVDPVWDNVKILNGQKPDQYKNNIPKDKIVDRIQFVKYPMNAGIISTHIDPLNIQNINFVMMCSEPGEDYKYGGLYLLDSNKDKVYVDEHLSSGDAIMFFPNLFHGVEEPRNTKKITKKEEIWTEKGRWNMIVSVVATHCSDNRITSKSYEQVIDGQ